ncbi:MAG TPA: 3'(2'),5'-bisphosphate nucleotidase CysQ [Stellaceae bacterium]|nr:3'(2'),5'-bisphosphate nucleotidase CysQ [Stellaceae bacterium]
MTAGELSLLLELARRAALRAGPAILDVYHAAAAPDVRHKSDASPVTLADERAEALITETLAAGAPNIPIIAEEHCDRHGIPTQTPPRFWLVDPLDGTKEFLRRNGEFTVNIALVEGDRPVLGIVHVPALGLTFAGAGPGSATRQRGTSPTAAINARPVPASGAVVLHSRSHANEAKIAEYLATLAAPVTRVSGSAVKFCLIAAAEADLYPRFGPTMEWDTAAGQAVLEAAGGCVLTPEGAPFRYGKPGFLNDNFIARGR